MSREDQIGLFKVVLAVLGLSVTVSMASIGFSVSQFTHDVEAVEEKIDTHSVRLESINQNRWTNEQHHEYADNVEERWERKWDSQTQIIQEIKTDVAVIREKIE